MKKFAALIFVLVMLVALAAPAFAAEPTGSITINGISEGNVYEIYRMLDLSLSESGTAYTYTVNAEWAGFFATAEAQKYITINEAGAASWVAAEDDDTKATFAKLALAYAEENGLTPLKSSANDGDMVITGNSGKFEGLELGYYLVDSTMGALCGLTTTNLNASINAKNGAPSVEKQVLEDSTEQWGIANTADIGQVVQYRVTISVHAGAQNYVLHDTMEAGLSFLRVTEIQHVVPGVETHVTDPSKYTVNTNTADGCDFEIVFSEEFCEDMESNDKVIVYYEALLTQEAEIHGETNDNVAWMTFGDSRENEAPHKSNESKVTTSTFAIDIVKTDSDDKLLPGAVFKIYDALTGGNEIAVILTADGHYHRAADRSTGDEIVVTDGKIRVEGLDNGTYYLEEIQEPDGYNRLTARQKFIVSDGNLDAITSAEGVYSSGSGVQVVNNTGSRLPETGGLGTLLFTILGGGTALGTGVVLVTKKRMSKIEDEE